MDFEKVDKIAKSVLYEGYLLYPYSQNSAKDQYRWNFGGLYPQSYVNHQLDGDASQMKTELLVEGSEGTEISFWIRFLHLITRKQQQIQWEEGQERELAILGQNLKELKAHPQTVHFDFPEREWTESVHGVSVTRIQKAIQGQVEVRAQQVKDEYPELWKIQILLRNSNPVEVKTRKEALPYSLATTHVLLSAHAGSFISMIDPHEMYRDHASRCENEGLWPILVGQAGKKDLVLSAPIILYDYPEMQ